jgi:hypothetical protein
MHFKFMLPQMGSTLRVVIWAYGVPGHFWFAYMGLCTSSSRWACWWSSWISQSHRGRKAWLGDHERCVLQEQKQD